MNVYNFCEEINFHKLITMNSFYAVLMEISTEIVNIYSQCLNLKIDPCEK